METAEADLIAEIQTFATTCDGSRRLWATSRLIDGRATICGELRRLATTESNPDAVQAADIRVVKHKGMGCGADCFRHLTTCIQRLRS